MVRLRPLPVADKGSNKNCRTVKICRRSKPITNFGNCWSNRAFAMMTLRLWCVLTAYFSCKHHFVVCQSLESFYNYSDLITKDINCWQKSWSDSSLSSGYEGNKGAKAAPVSHTAYKAAKYSLFLGSSTVTKSFFPTPQFISLEAILRAQVSMCKPCR